MDMRDLIQHPRLGLLFPVPEFTRKTGLTVVNLLRPLQLQLVALLAGMYAQKREQVAIISPAEDLLADEILPTLEQLVPQTPDILDRVEVLAEPRLTARNYALPAGGQTVHAGLTRVADAMSTLEPDCRIILPLSHLIADEHLARVLNVLGGNPVETLADTHGFRPVRDQIAEGETGPHQVEFETPGHSLLATRDAVAPAPETVRRGASAIMVARTSGHDLSRVNLAPAKSRWDTRDAGDLVWAPDRTEAGAGQR